MALSWEERNEKARALGYRNYYDYRIHGYGSLPPDEEPDEEERGRYSGQRSRSALLADLGEGDVVSVWTKGPRDITGQYEFIDIHVMHEDGEEDMYRLRGRFIEADALADLVDDIEDAGAIISPAPSLDIRGL